MEGDHSQPVEASEHVTREVLDEAGVTGELLKETQAQKAASIYLYSSVLGKVYRFESRNMLKECFVYLLDFHSPVRSHCFDCLALSDHVLLWHPLLRGRHHL